MGEKGGFPLTIKYKWILMEQVLKTEIIILQPSYSGKMSQKSLADVKLQKETPLHIPKYLSLVAKNLKVKIKNK